MGFQKYDQKSQPPKRGLLKALAALLFFPLKVRKRYLRYNAALQEAASENKSTQSRLLDYRRNNIKLLNIFIHAPLGLAAAVVMYMAYAQIDTVSRLVEKASSIPSISLSKPKATVLNVKRYFKDVQAVAKKIDFKHSRYALAGCYGFCFIGAIFLSMNIAWREEEIIKEALSSNRYFDVNGEPWKTYWTPDAIIFHTYQCDPDAFAENSKFWNTINFRPDVPVQFKHDANKLIVARAYTLPYTISFEIKRGSAG